MNAAINAAMEQISESEFDRAVVGEKQMLTNEARRYLPRAEHSLAGKAEKLYRMFAYDVWRRELGRFSREQNTVRLRVVDVGCGPGFLLGCIERWFPAAELIGVDQSEDLLMVAQSRCKSMTALQGDASRIPLPDASTDAAFALHVVEHLQEPDDFFREARRVVRPGGLLVVATPNLDGLGAKLMKRKWSGYSDPTHISLHGETFWSESMARSGFEITHRGTTGLSGIPLLKSMPLSLIHWIPTFLCGYFPWKLGEACVCVAIRRAEETVHVH
jgi:SAM-dependent methyltransferase